MSNNCHAWAARNDSGHLSSYELERSNCYKIPEKYPLALAAPLLCAGITVSTPMIHHKMNGPGKSIEVIGLGGLGHLAGLSKTLEFIIDTASGDHPFDLYLSLLKTGGVPALVGYPGEEIKLSPLRLLMGMRTVSQTSHEIYPKVKVIPIQYANEALDRLQKGDVKYRSVIDIESSLE
ncbi:hypothetical protein EUGRSUZ_D00473 [Eucalyptus grandis]|uniref:Alcohol dehydrogenase-like C-terminal domain-containing protein n=1 Tax=Eucalyptus grandis TaxID=71139 RepID=A0A059CCB2_EUCGR|nr:hypothetical protein EUGRSUZ_D00473 [Eucalyptus grandis]